MLKLLTTKTADEIADEVQRRIDEEVKRQEEWRLAGWEDVGDWRESNGELHALRAIQSFTYRQE